VIPRRGLLAGLGALLASPAIIRTPGLLMPVRPLREPLWFGVDMASGPDITVLSRAIDAALARRMVPFVDADGAEYYIALDGNPAVRRVYVTDQYEVTDRAQRRLLFGDWPAADSGLS